MSLSFGPPGRAAETTGNNYGNRREAEWTEKKTIHQPNNTPPSSERGRLERLHARIRTDRIDRVIGYTHVRCVIYILLSLWTVVAHARKH